MHIKLETLRTFLTVADCGSLTEAGNLLSRTPSAISMTLKQFEEQLGASLFETDRKSSLTPLGLFVLEESRRAVNSFDEATHSIQRFAQGEIGNVRVATVPSVATRLLPEIAKNFMATAPQVRLELRDLDSSLVVNSVRNNSVDFGIGSLSSATSDLLMDKFLEEPFGVVCHQDHELANSSAPISWEQLKQVNFISNGLCDTILNTAVRELVKSTSLHIYNVSTLLRFVHQGIGVTLLPRLAVTEQNLLFLPLVDKQVIRTLYFLQHRHHRLNPAAQQFQQLIRDTAEAILQAQYKKTAVDN